jgi:hypothetical protein
MSDIDTYLTELRSHLSDLDPRRADEIIAEARTHLDSRAAQLRAAGVGEDEAIGEALAAFGDPGRMAQDLIDKNSRHRHPAALRALAAITITLGAAFALAGLYATPQCWKSPSLLFLAHHTGLAPEPAGWLLLLIQLLPAAYLAGVVCGPRFWWLAGVPGVFWIGLCWIPSLVSGNLPPSATLPHQLRYALIVPGLAALVLAATGRVGAGLAASRSRLLRRAAQAITAICAAYVLSLGFVALGRALDSPEGQSLAAAVAVPVALIFVATARRDRHLNPRSFAILFAGVSATGLVFVAAVALLLLSLGVSLSVLGQYTAPSLAIAAVTSALGLLAALTYWRRTQPEPSPGQSNLPPASGHPG